MAYGQEQARMSGLLSDAGGGTRTPDTRIMIGAVALVFDPVQVGFVGFGGVRPGEICGVGDMARDMVWGGGSGASTRRASVRLVARDERRGPVVHSRRGGESRCSVEWVGEVVAVAELD